MRERKVGGGGFITGIVSFQLCRLRSPIICHLQIGERGKPVVQFSSSSKSWEPGCQCSRPGEDGCFHSSKKRKFTLPLLFCSTRVVSELDDAHLHWWGLCPSSVYLLKCSSPGGGPSRWQRSKTWRSPSSPQIHQKYIYMWNNSHRTPTERWPKTSDLPKGKKLPTYLGRAKEKRKNRDKE